MSNLVEYSIEAWITPMHEESVREALVRALQQHAEVDDFGVDPPDSVQPENEVAKA